MTLDAAEHVGAAGDVGRYDVLGLLSALVDKSLVQVNDSGDRYRLLDTIRAYGAEELEHAGEHSATRDRHLSFFAGLGERAEKAMWVSATALWLGRLDAERDNLRAALDWSLASAQADSGARLLYSISHFLFIRCLRTEGRRRCEAFLAYDLTPARRAELYELGAIFCHYSDPATALAYAQALVSLGEELGDERATARGMDYVGWGQALTDPLTALTTLGEAIAGPGPPTTASPWLTASAGANFNLSRFRDALRCAEEALSVAQQIGYTWGTCFATSLVAAQAAHVGELGRAAAAADAVMAMARDLDDQNQTQSAHYFRGVVATFRSEPSAAPHLAAARRLAERTGDNFNLVGIACDQGALALALGHGEEARRILEEVLPAADALQPMYGARARRLLAEVAIRQGELAGPGACWTMPWRRRWPILSSTAAGPRPAWPGREETTIWRGSLPTRGSAQFIAPVGSSW